MIDTNFLGYLCPMTGFVGCTLDSSLGLVEFKLAIGATILFNLSACLFDWFEAGADVLHTS